MLPCYPLPSRRERQIEYNIYRYVKSEWVRFLLLTLCSGGSGGAATGTATGCTHLGKRTSRRAQDTIEACIGGCFLPVYRDPFGERTNAVRGNGGGLVCFCLCRNPLAAVHLVLEFGHV